MISPAPERAAKLLAAAKAAEEQLHRLLDLTARAEAALQQADGDALVAAITARGELFPTAEAAFTRLRTLRESLPAASPAPPELETALLCCDDVGRLADSLAERSGRLEQDLAAARGELARRLAELEQGKPSARCLENTRHIDIRR